MEREDWGGDKGQRKLDRRIAGTISEIKQCVPQINLLLRALRDVFIKCVPFSINFKDVLTQIKYDLVEFAKNSLKSAGRLATDFSKFLAGQNPVTGIKFVDDSGAPFDSDSLATSMPDTMKFIFNGEEKSRSLIGSSTRSARPG